MLGKIKNHQTMKIQIFSTRKFQVMRVSKELQNILLWQYYCKEFVWTPPNIIMSSSHLLNEWSICRSIGKTLFVLFQKLYARLSTKTNRIANCNIPNFISCDTQEHMTPILPERSSHILLKPFRRHCLSDFEDNLL